MRAQRKYFSPEFKREAVRRAGTGDATVLEVARELGIRSDRLREWITQVKGTARRRSGTADAATGGPILSLDEEVRQLRRENAQLKEERDILLTTGRDPAPVRARAPS